MTRGIHYKAFNEAVDEGRRSLIVLIIHSQCPRRQHHLQVPRREDDLSRRESEAEHSGSPQAPHVLEQAEGMRTT